MYFPSAKRKENKKSVNNRAAVAHANILDSFVREPGSFNGAKYIPPLSVSKRFALIRKRGSLNDVIISNTRARDIHASRKIFL